MVGGSGVLQHLSAPMLSLVDHAALMIILSDNTSTNVVIDAVGMANVNARMKALGLGDIQLRRKMMDAAAVRRGDENVASPASLGQGRPRSSGAVRGCRSDSRDAARRILYRGPAARFAAPFPAACAWPARPGRLDGVRAEAAVVELEGRPFALAVDDDVPAQPMRDGERAIGEVADAAFSYFERLAPGGAYGRKAP